MIGYSLICILTIELSLVWKSNELFQSFGRCVDTNLEGLFLVNERGFFFKIDLYFHHGKNPHLIWYTLWFCTEISNAVLQMGAPGLADPDKNSICRSESGSDPDMSSTCRPESRPDPERT